jgi:hypothetical protein
MHQIKYGWNDYFSGISITTTEQGAYTSRRTHSTTSVYVINCLFSNCNSGSGGGALYCTSNFLLIESSSFSSCKASTSNGGAVYFVNRNSGQCVLNEVCGYDCILTGGSHGQFARMDVYNVASSKNYINYSSVSRCVNEVSSTSDTICLVYGKIYCTSTNISMNKCYSRSGIYCISFSDSNSVISSLSYSSIADNIASQEICIWFNSNGAKCEIKCCNILRNTQGSLDSSGAIRSYGSLMIEDSCILENEANNIFYQQSSYTITLSKCTVDKTTCNQNLVIQSTVTKSFILALNHMSTQNCHSEYDSAGYLIVIPDKKVFCYTNKINHCQARISDFFSFICLFMFIFIHLDPYGDY